MMMCGGCLKKENGMPEKSPPPKWQRCEKRWVCVKQLCKIELILRI